MTYIWITLALCTGLALFADINGQTSYMNNGKKSSSIIILGTVITIFVVVSGLRDSIGDTDTYRKLYNALSTDAIDVFLNGGADSGFYAFAALIKQYISYDSQVFLFVAALVTITSTLIMLYHIAKNYSMSTFLFVTTGIFLVSMNGVRQYFVSGLLFLLTPLIKQKKWVTYFAVVLILTTMHQTALIFIPLYFVVNRKGWSNTTYLILASGAFLYITYPVTGPMIASLLSSSQYENYSEAITSGEDGANIIRVAVAFVPLILSYIGRKSRIQHEKYYDIVVNFSALNAVAMLLANRYWIYARFSMYFTPYYIILMIWCVRYLFDKRNRYFVTAMLFVLYAIFFWYDNESINLIYSSKYF